MIRERIYIFLKHIGIKPTPFEKMIGVGNGLLTKDRAGVSSIVLEKIHNKCPELNMDWVITGRGEMLYQEQTAIAGTGITAEDVRKIVQQELQAFGKNKK